MQANPPLPANKKTSKNDLQTVIDSVDSDIEAKYRRQFTGLIQEFTSVFSSSEWDLGQCDATAHRIDVYRGSKSVKIPNRRTPVLYKDDLQSQIDVFNKKRT